MGIGYQELILIFLIVLLLFGGKKIPEIARGMGKGIREFRKAKEDIRDAIEYDDIDSPASPAPASEASEASGAPEATEAGEAVVAEVSHCFVRQTHFYQLNGQQLAVYEHVGEPAAVVILPVRDPFQ